MILKNHFETAPPKRRERIMDSNADFNRQAVGLAGSVW